MWRTIAVLQMVLASVVWLLAMGGVWMGREPFLSWLYFFAWWPLLLFLDGALLYLRQESWMWRRPGQFLLMCFWSVTIWLVFEAYNLVLHNWGYVEVEARLWWRWPGYALAFATVLPGLLLSAEVLAALGFWQGRQGVTRRLGVWQPWALYFGVACLVLPLTAPGYAFPLIWLGFIFLLDPLSDLFSGDSLLGRWLAGERQRHFCLLTAGLFCGLWWELWNYPARTKWIYTLPVFNFARIFEMPVLGYLGFPPFALECAVMSSFLHILHRRFLTNPRRRRWAWWGQVAFWLVMFMAMDAWTVISYQ